MLSAIHGYAGKVHGSLARAGKVRGQTPKVQKQDKKKQPKGRAMKRIKYNRRFVNVGEFIERCLLAVTAPTRQLAEGSGVLGTTGLCLDHIFVLSHGGCQALDI